MIALLYLFIVTPLAFVAMIGVLAGIGAAARMVTRWIQRLRTPKPGEQASRRRAA